MLTMYNLGILEHRISNFDLRFIGFLKKSFNPFARVAIFVVYFWFGLLKLLNASPASPLAQALVNNTVGAKYYGVLFMILAFFECVIGALFLFPKATRIVIPLLFIHMLIVCSPLLFVSNLAWGGILKPTLEGQYIIKNLVIIALAIGIAAQTSPITQKKRRLV